MMAVVAEEKRPVAMTTELVTVMSLCGGDNVVSSSSDDLLTDDVPMSAGHDAADDRHDPSPGIHTFNSTLHQTDSTHT